MIKTAKKYLEGDVTPEEKRELESLVQNSIQFDKWFYTQLENCDEEIDPNIQQKMLDKIEAQISAPHTKRKNRKLHKIFRYSAAAVLLPFAILLGMYMAHYWSENPSAEVAVAVEKGNRANVHLPDSSVVCINSDSKLAYNTNYGKEERRLTLDGEAYFQVKKSQDIPFIVEANNLEIKVMGTEFDIKSYPNQEDISVVLVSGSVKVKHQDSEVQLKPNQKLIYNKQSQSIKIENVYASDYIEWTKGNLYFDNETLENIAKALSRVYNVEVRFRSPQLRQLRFTGTLVGSDLDSALKVIALTSPIKYQKKEAFIEFR